METRNFLSFFAGGTKGRELAETRAAWEQVQRQWAASPLRGLDVPETAAEIVRQTLADEERAPASPVIAALCEATEVLFRVESITEIEPFWSAIEERVEVAVEFREMLTRRSRWATQFDNLKGSFSRQLGAAFHVLIAALPEACFAERGEANTFGVPLIDLLENPAQVIESLLRFPFSNESLHLDLFRELRVFLRRNMLAASGIPAEEEMRERDRIVPPSEQKNKSARELADLYLADTPLAALLNLPAPFALDQQVRFEHCHVIAGTGHGKTQFLQKMIFDDLVASIYDNRSVVVIDSQGDLIRKLSNLELFSPYVGGGLGERLVLIDPSDIEHPPALNLFDAHMDRVRTYGLADRERVLNGVVELYETFFDALLGAELTARQNVVFRYIARLMLTIPGATIHTLMELMTDGRAFKPYMEKLEGSAKRFFETEFFSPAFSATKSQVSKRLWGVLSTPSFDRMFSQTENKLDLFHALNSGKIILVNTAKDVLKEDGSRLFGRFFMAMLVQATLERSIVPEARRTPTFVYVDEAHEYFDDRIETVLNQARKYKVSLTLAHQNLDQLSQRLRAALLTNTSIKCVGGVSAKDARALADELHTTTEFIDAMRKRGGKTEFALWVKHQTAHAVRLAVPLGYLERQHALDDEDYDTLIERNRARYCGTLAPREPDATPVPEVPASYSPPPAAPRAEPRPAPVRETERMLGKGGPKHTYLQALAKELAEAQGLKATIEAPLPDGGQVDVLLERDGAVAAIEISVTTPVEHERENLAKCLAAGFPKIAVVLAKSKVQQSAYRAALFDSVPESDRERVSYLTPEELPDYIASLAPKPEPTERFVKGYRVKSAVTAVSAEDAKARRDAVARLIAQSLIKSGQQ